MFKKGDTITWLSSTYIIVELDDKFANIKQKFSIGIILEKIPISELRLK